MKESLFLAPFAGWAAGGGGPGPRDPGSQNVGRGAPSSSFGPSTDEKLRLAQEKKIREKELLRKRLESLPNRQIPGEFPAYSWGGYERKDWNYRWGKLPAESLVRSPLRLLGERELAVPPSPPHPSLGVPHHTPQPADPNKGKVQALRTQLNQIKQKIAALRPQLQQALAASRAEQQKDPEYKNIQSLRSVTAQRAQRAAHPGPVQIDWGGQVSEGFALGANTSQVINLRKQISDLEMQAANIRNQIRQIKGTSPVKSISMPGMRPSTMSAKPVQHHVAALQRARQASVASKPARSPAIRSPQPIGAGAHESHETHLRLIRDEPRWRTLLKFK